MHERLTKLSSCPIKISPALVKGILATWFPQLLFWFSLSPESSQHLPTGLLFLPHVPHPDGKDEIPSMQICLQPSPVTQPWCHDLQNKDRIANQKLKAHMASPPAPLPFPLSAPLLLLFWSSPNAPRSIKPSSLPSFAPLLVYVEIPPPLSGSGVLSALIILLLLLGVVCPLSIM